MGNTLTDLAPTLYSAAQEVSNEPFGVVDAIYTDFDNKGVAKGDSVKVPVAPTRAASNFTPAAASSSGSDAIADAVEVSITESRKVSWHLTGEQQRSLANGGTQQEWVRQLIAQGMRTLRNEAEEDAFEAVYKGASRAAGEAGTTPFQSNLDELIDVRKILRDNGAPMSDLQLVVDTAAEVELLKLSVVQQAYAAGSDAERRQGTVGRQFGFRISQSAGISIHTKGNATGYDIAAGALIGDTTLSVDGSDSGTMLAGDIIQFDTDGYNYVVHSNTVDGSATGDIVIGRPGLVAALTAADEGVTGDSYTPNLAFERNAVVGIMRPPLVPANPTITQLPISDGKGMTYLLLDIAQYGQRTWELHLAWGFKTVQPEHVAILMG